MVGVALPGQKSTVGHKKPIAVAKKKKKGLGKQVYIGGDSSDTDDGPAMVPRPTKKLLTDHPGKIDDRSSTTPTPKEKKSRSTKVPPEQLKTRKALAIQELSKLKMNEGWRTSITNTIQQLTSWDDQTGSTTMVREMNHEIDMISVKYAQADPDDKAALFDENSASNTTIARLFVVWAMNPDRENGLSPAILNRAARVLEKKKVSGEWWTAVCADFKRFVEGRKPKHGWMEVFKSTGDDSDSDTGHIKKKSDKTPAKTQPREDDTSDSDTAQATLANNPRQKPANTQPRKDDTSRMRSDLLAGDNGDSNSDNAQTKSASNRLKRFASTQPPKDAKRLRFDDSAGGMVTSNELSLATGGDNNSYSGISPTRPDYKHVYWQTGDTAAPRKNSFEDEEDLGELGEQEDINSYRQSPASHTDAIATPTLFTDSNTINAMQLDTTTQPNITTVAKHRKQDAGIDPKYEKWLDEYHKNRKQKSDVDSIQISTPTQTRATGLAGINTAGVGGQSNEGAGMSPRMQGRLTGNAAMFQSPVSDFNVNRIQTSTPTPTTSGATASSPFAWLQRSELIQRLTETTEELRQKDEEVRKLKQDMAIIATQAGAGRDYLRTVFGQLEKITKTAMDNESQI